MYTIVWVVIALITIVTVWYITTFNKLIHKRNRVEQCQSGICVALKQRNDMIPNLVASVKTYMVHEKETLERITELRVRAEQATGEQEQIELGNQLSGLLSKLQVSVERYPELKANEQFKMLQDSVEEMEYQLQAIRRTFNAAVTDYNNYIEMFPSSIVASGRHTRASLIDIPDPEKKNVDVNDLFNR